MSGMIILKGLSESGFLILPA